MQSPVEGQAAARSASVAGLLGGAGKIRLDQLKIVALLFLVIFVAYSLILPGFFSIGNLLTLMRTVAVLGILGLGMAIVVIGRGIDLSMIAALAVPSALVLMLAAKGYGVVPALGAGLLMAIAIGILNGVLVAYAEIPSLFATLAVGIGVAGIGQIGLFDFEIGPPTARPLTRRASPLSSVASVAPRPKPSRSPPASTVSGRWSRPTTPRAGSRRAPRSRRAPAPSGATPSGCRSSAPLRSPPTPASPPSSRPPPWRRPWASAGPG